MFVLLERRRGWTLLRTCGPFWERVHPFGNVWTLLGTCGPFWERVDPFGNVWTLLGT